MAKARAIIKRRKSVQNIKKITRTMELIATARFKKALDRATEAAAYTRKIAELVAKLRAENEEFAQAAAGWTDDDVQRKKDILLSRTQTMIAVDLQLARLGEIALVRELERLPFAHKLRRLQAFLAAANEP